MSKEKSSDCKVDRIRRSGDIRNHFSGISLRRHLPCFSPGVTHRGHHASPTDEWWTSLSKSLDFENLGSYLSKPWKEDGIDLMFLKPGRVLTPGEEFHSPQSFPTFAQRFIDKEPGVRWGDKFRLRGAASTNLSFHLWVAEMLSEFRNELKKCNLLTAVACARGRYDSSKNMMRALIEAFCPLTNSWIFPWGEAGITLEELFHISGLPLTGFMYDECIPENALLYGILEDGETSYYKPETHNLFEIFDQIVKEIVKDDPTLKKKNINHGQWMSYFLDFYDPSGNIIHPFASKRTVLQVARIERRSSPRISRKTYFSAFLALFLSRFALPNQEESVRAETFVMAGEMANGATYAVGLAVLASIFYGFDQLKRCDDPGNSGAHFPVHYFFGWVGAHFPSTYHLRDFELKPGIPFLLSIVERAAGPHSLKGARELVRNPLSFKFRPFGHFLPDNIQLSWEDQANPDRDTSVFSIEILHYFLSLRQNLLPLRFGNCKLLEPYYPARYARQLGYDQIIPPTPLSIDARKDVTIADLVMAFNTYNARGTKSCFTTRPAHVSGRTSLMWCYWWYENTNVYFSKRLSELAPNKPDSDVAKFNALMHIPPEFFADIFREAWPVKTSFMRSPGNIDIVNCSSFVGFIKPYTIFENKSDEAEKSSGKRVTSQKKGETNKKPKSVVSRKGEDIMSSYITSKAQGTSTSPSSGYYVPLPPNQNPGYMAEDPIIPSPDVFLTELGSIPTTSHFSNMGNLPTPDGCIEEEITAIDMHDQQELIDALLRTEDMVDASSPANIGAGKYLNDQEFEFGNPPPITGTGETMGLVRQQSDLDNRPLSGSKTVKVFREEDSNDDGSDTSHLCSSEENSSSEEDVQTSEAPLTVTFAESQLTIPSTIEAISREKVNFILPPRLNSQALTTSPTSNIAELPNVRLSRRDSVSRPEPSLMNTDVTPFNPPDLPVSTIITSSSEVSSKNVEDSLNKPILSAFKRNRIRSHLKNIIELLKEVLPYVENENDFAIMEQDVYVACDEISRIGGHDLSLRSRVKYILDLSQKIKKGELWASEEVIKDDIIERLHTIEEERNTISSAMANKLFDISTLEETVKIRIEKVNTLRIELEELEKGIANSKQTLVTNSELVQKDQQSLRDLEEQKNHLLASLNGIGAEKKKRLSVLHQFITDKDAAIDSLSRFDK